MDRIDFLWRRFFFARRAYDAGGLDLNYKLFLVVGLAIGLVAGIVLGGTLLAKYFPQSRTPTAQVVRSIVNATLVLDPGNGTIDTTFGEHLTPQQPVNVTVTMISGNFTAGVDFSILGPCASNQCGTFKYYKLDLDQRSVSFVLDESTSGFQPGTYQMEFIDVSTTIVATVYVNITEI